MYFFYSISSFLLLLILIISFIGFLMRRRRHKKLHPYQDKEWYLQFALSKEDAVSQLFLLLSFFFLGVTLLAFNHDFGEPLSWISILFITSVIGLVGAYYLKTIYTLAFSVVGLTSWWAAKGAQWMDAEGIRASVLLASLSFFALIFFLLGHLHGKQMKYKRFALVYLVFGIIPITGELFFFSTKVGLLTFGRMTTGNSFFSSWQLALSLFIFLISIVGIAIYAAMRKLLFPFEMFAVLALTCLFGIIALLPEQNMLAQTGCSYYSDIDFGDGRLSNTGILWALVFNFTTFFELLGLIFSGYSRREIWLINLGALFLFSFIIVKYFDWFFTFSDKSIFLIGAGVLLFVIGWFMEKGRRYMISNIKSQARQIRQ